MDLDATLPHATLVTGMSSYLSEIREQPTDPLGGASGDKRLFTVQFLAKSNNQAFPFTVANEIVATALGQALGLNLPTVLTFRVAGQVLAFIQMVDRDPSMTSGPPATAKALQEFVAQHPDEVHAAIVFDLFVANNDRAFAPERRNLLLDSSGRLLLYDQGNACFYRHRRAVNIEAGVPRLTAVEQSLEAMFDMQHKENYYFQLLSRWDLVEKWCERIKQMPQYLIEAAVARIPAGLDSPNAEERQLLTKFLIARSQYLCEHIVRWQSLFPGLPERNRHG